MKKMSLEILADDLLVQIFHCLLKDSRSFINLASTSKRLNLIANHCVVNTPEWAQSRPLAFDLYLEPNLYRPELCRRHGRCAEQEVRSGARCEIQSPSGDKLIKIGANIRGKEDNETYIDNDKCYYHRLYCMLNSTYLTFSTIRFRRARLSDRGCIKSFHDSLLRGEETLIRTKINALVELELYKCDITLDWLNTILNHMDNIKYLALNEVAFNDSTILVEDENLASKKLQRLGITCDRTCRITDTIFTYFLDNFSAVELDITGTRVEYHKRIIQRFYPTSSNALDVYVNHKPSEHILSFPIILLYLRKYQTVIKRFVASETDITLYWLRKILQEADLKHLQITLRDCLMFERTQLADQMDEEDLARLTW